MSKIICDVCGAAYPETSSRCPVCGSVHYGTPEAASNEAATARRERENKRTTSSAGSKATGNNRRNRSKRTSPLNKYLVIGVALIVVLVILISLIASSCGGEEPTEPTATTAPPATTLPEETTLPPVLCTGVTLSSATIKLTEIGQSITLTAVTTPVDTTEMLVFRSSDPAVVKVDNRGVLVAVSAGTAQVTVTCGEASAVCEVTVQLLPDAILTLNRNDFSLFFKGAFWQVYDGEIDLSLITFSSDDESIATFVDGKVTAVAPGTTTVYAEYGDQKVSCIVRCVFKADTTSGGNGSVEPDNGTSGSEGYTLWNSYGPDLYRDATLKIGETLEIYLKDSAGNKITIEWTMSKEGIVTIDGRTVTGADIGNVTLSGTHNGMEINYIIRVAPAAAG